MPAGSPATSRPSRPTRPPGTPSSIFASHEYGCGTLPSEPSIAAAGKEYWETEVDTGTGERRLQRRWYRQRAVDGHDDSQRPHQSQPQRVALWWLYNASGNGGCLYDTSNEGVDQAAVGPGQLRALRAAWLHAGVHLGNRAVGRAGERLHQSRPTTRCRSWRSTATPRRRMSRSTSPAAMRRARSRPTRPRRARTSARALPSPSRSRACR